MPKITLSFVSFMALFVVLSVPTLQAQTLTVLYSFRADPDGVAPDAGLLRDKTGNLYGTTVEGGTLGHGTVFQVDKSGDETVLHSFQYTPDGQSPLAALIMDEAGNLYGTTEEGGEMGRGTVFKVDTSGNETVLHLFTGSPDGAFPVARLVMDKRGNLYGTTVQGGFSDVGTVFKLDTAGHETVLHSFAGSDGAYPIRSDLVMDKEGNLYGTTYGGGSFGAGTVFKLDSAGHETVLHSFAGSDGAAPMGGLVNDRAGNLYGTTSGGGPFNAGIVFKLDRAGHETVLHRFSGSPDGTSPTDDLVIDKAGSLYGTTYSGGSSGAGTVFKVDNCGNETVLHAFTDAPDGAVPFGGVVMDKRGNLYGTTERGGTYGHGVVFELIPSDCDEHHGLDCNQRHGPDCHEPHGQTPRLNP